MRILEYAGLDTRRVQAQYKKVAAAIARDDFRSAEVKKIGGGGQPYYRARLDDSNRLLFMLVRFADQRCALMLEVILNHDYAGSRFLRGASVDESKIVDVSLTEASAQPLRYLHPERTQLQMLDKPLSFDDAQHAIYQHAAPLIVVGSAGSGKTALTLEKLKHAVGDVLYVTHSAFLAQGARDLYYAHGFARDEQDAVFLSYREFLETLQVPQGQEATWPRFKTWFARMQHAFRGIDAHQAFEEIRGVITAPANDALTREQYRSLGVRQSIFADAQRDVLFDLYEKYRAWLRSEGLFDLNLLAHERMAMAAPRYDFVVVDEVQDLTIAQLALVLKTLRKPGQFLLCGDSNQIVHPNFFAWSQVKTLFWRDAELASRQELRVLAANYRNAAQTTALANMLLKIKHQRFGSIDRESNFLVEAIGGETGQASLISDRDGSLRELDKQTRLSAQVAVLVMRDEDKSAARKQFGTPLLFSVQEAKGLEYEHIILYRFISDHRAEFAEVAAGVSPDDLLGDELEYRRARDKSDKSLEVYKFYINALYVALTRAVRNVYLVESDLGHPLLALLPVHAGDAAAVRAQASSREDWQREARRLELQGKQEQAAAIRRDVLKQALPPWPVLDGARVNETLVKLFRERYPSNKAKQQLLDYAAFFDHPSLAEGLHAELQFGSVTEFLRIRGPLKSKQLTPYLSKNFKEILRQCEQYGPDFRSPLNLTPLMLATIAGNLALIAALLERGADIEAADNHGQTALHWALRLAFQNPSYAATVLPVIYEGIAPASIDLQSSKRLVRLDRHLAEYQLFQTLWALIPGLCTHWDLYFNGNFDTAMVLKRWEQLPSSVLAPLRRRRPYISAVLSRNEIGRDYAYNRGLFQRMERGAYRLAPDLALRVRENGEQRWVPIGERQNLSLLLESAHESSWPHLSKLIGGADAVRVPIVTEQRVAKEEAAKAQRLADEQKRREAQAQAQAAAVNQRARAVHAQRLAEIAQTEVEPTWGTPAAKRLALERALALRKPPK